ncbi:hypothetical protein [Methylibium petroleiphilum]|uniref:hypothetical protein n=1 Tax=Methylibium petroleiphilum TaxID=105560 RepID=UPI003D2E6C6A
MKLRFRRLGRGVASLGLAAVVCSSAAVETAPGEDTAPNAPWTMQPASPSWPSRAQSELRDATRQDAAFKFSIVELPRYDVPGAGRPRRAHHALSMSSETPQRMLRSIGVEATDCATRLRLPTRLRQDRDGSSVEMRAHLGLACRF